LSADGATVWIGTVKEQVAAIDTASLQVKALYTTSGLLLVPPVPNTAFDRPEELLALSNGRLMMRLRQAQTPEALLALWDPTSNTATNLTPAEPQLFQNGLGAMARTGDRTKVLVAANDTSGELAEFDSNGNVVEGPHGLGIGRIPLVAANADGSRFAVAFNASGNLQILLLDGSLTQIEAHASAGINGIAFSRDGNFLYVSENAGPPPVITVLDGHDVHMIGQVPDLWIQGGRSEIEEADETKLLFGVANRGISFVDAATPGTLPANVPTLAGAPSVLPSEGPNAGGTATVLAGQNFEATAQVQFGGQAASNVGVTGNTQTTAMSAPNAENGAVNIAAYFPSGWIAIAPDAFSYGPEVLEILPNAGAQAGGETLQIYGYGFGTDASKFTVKIGGASAVVQSVENVTTIAPSLGLGTNYPFSLERITVTTPAGSAGKTDVVVSSGAGTVTSAKSFQYLQGETFFAKPALEKFIFYDQKRRWLYLSNIAQLDVFDLAAGQFRAAGISIAGLAAECRAPRIGVDARQHETGCRRFWRPERLSDQSGRRALERVFQLVVSRAS
jgi:IPT/TIG domain